MLQGNPSHRDVCGVMQLPTSPGSWPIYHLPLHEQPRFTTPPVARRATEVDESQGKRGLEKPAQVDRERILFFREFQPVRARCRDDGPCRAPLPATVYPCRSVDLLLGSRGPSDDFVLEVEERLPPPSQGRISTMLDYQQL